MYGSRFQFSIHTTVLPTVWPGYKLNAFMPTKLEIFEPINNKHVYEHALGYLYA